MNSPASAESQDSLAIESKFVAPTLAATAPAPEPARRISFFRALALFWLLPKRYGPHLAAASFKRALAAHLIASLVFALLMGFVAVFVQSEEPKAWFELSLWREQLAAFILEMASFTSGSDWSWAYALMVMGGIPLAEVGLLALATVVMPFAADGDRASSVWKRSVKNVYWCTSFLMPGSALAALIYVLGNRSSNPFAGSAGELVLLLAAILAAVLLLILLMRAVLVGAHRYVGPPDGPAFAPREPRCDECGYLIIGLPLDSKCPECGLPVSDSLPGGRRRPSHWQEHEMKPRGFVEAAWMQWVIIRDCTFLRRLPVQSGLGSARHFWWATWALMVLLMLLLMRIGVSLLPVGGDWLVEMTPVSMGIAVLPLILQAVVMSTGCLGAQFRCGIQDYRVSAVVCYYASPLMWPFLLMALATVFLFLDPVSEFLRSVYQGQLGSVAFSAADIAQGLAILGAMTGLGFWWYRLARAIRGARFANV